MPSGMDSLHPPSPHSSRDCTTSAVGKCGPEGLWPRQRLARPRVPAATALH